MRAPGARAILAALTAAAACACTSTPGPDPDEPDPPAPIACEVGRTSAALGLADRAIVGPADGYPADAALRGRDVTLQRSQRSRRAAAWEVVERVLTPVAMTEDLPVEEAGVTAELPRFQTWYGRDDFQRMFHRLYLELGPEGRRARAAFGDSSIDEALGWNAVAVHETPSWPLERYQAYVEAIGDAAEVGGIGGIGRVSYSPAATRHLLSSYAASLPCVHGEVPPPFVDGDGPAERLLVRQPIDIAACEARELGPFFVGGGERLRARVQGAASVRLLGGPPEARHELCVALGDEPCETAGPGPVTVVVTAGDPGGRAIVTVDLGEAQPAWAACLDSPFPLDGAVVKADWRRADFGAQLPVHHTSAEALAGRLTADGAVDWGEGDGTADPGPDDIYTVVLPNGQRYRLAALHVMTKELDHWMWVSLWWSPDPASDFGADRPAAIGDLGGPWSHYKMCTSTSFREHDPDPSGGFAGSAPSLGRALAAVHAGDAAPSWCSNPYIEIGPGNAATNCIGCHQHGGTGILPETILDDPRFPDHGRLQVRNNFATDYSWAVDAGDRLGRVIADEVEYYDSFE